jgi:hypothetical protein
MSFESDLEGYFTKTTKRLSDVSQLSTILVMSAVVLETAVDTGALRGAWTPANGDGVIGGSEVLDPTGELTIDRIKETVLPLAVNSLSNTLPYANVVEYGLYPNPPKKATGKTAGGYSTQSPQGMISPNIIFWDNFVKEAVKEVG